ncbi:MAG: hypothetical protein LBC61_05675 [Candidatus Peribacteria bacterium]|nr:hypothetical protein [Candidatus Peribacteria bacterium]
MYDLAVDPQMSGDKSKLASFLVDIVYKELCAEKTNKVCEDNLYKYLRVLSVENFVNEEKFIKSLLEEKIISRLVQTRVTSVLIDKELDQETIEKLKSLNIP